MSWRMPPYTVATLGEEMMSYKTNSIQNQQSKKLNWDIATITIICGLQFDANYPNSKSKDC